jgi:Rha family phage regulatory protein
MEKLVIIQEEKALTTSLKVAEVFGKVHKNVVRDIENLLKDLLEIGEKDALNFEPIFYQDNYGREQRAYQMNRDGFTLLAMGYTGAKALKFKLLYIEAFNKMEAHLREMQKTILNNDELALIFNLINFFRYLEHCKQIEERHKKTYIIGKLKDNTKKYEDLAKQFYVMRNNLLEIGNTKQLQERYKKYCLSHPNVRYVSNADKFLMVFSMDKYEPIRHAIADFLKLELHTDGYTLKLANQANDLAKRGNVDLEVRNETNLFQEKEEELVDLSKLKYLASTLLEIGA